MNSTTWPLFPVEDPFPALAALAGSASPLVVDGGANKGRTVARLLELLPQCSLVAYEPLPRLARKLGKRFRDDARVRLREAALGSAPARLAINELESATCSSLLEPKAILQKHPDKPMGVARRVEVEVVRLDQDLRETPQLIKLDLQGYELEALRGAEGLLGGVRGVLCEVSFAGMYKGQPLAGELMAWMEARGFRVRGLYRPWFDEDGNLSAADALFERR